MLRYFAIAFLVASLSACADDPVSYSAPVTLKLKTKSDDTQQGVVTAEKSITTEAGNPYGEFVKDARAQLGGRDPSLVEIESVQLVLGGGSTGVAGLEEVFGANVESLFQIDTSNRTYVAAGTSSPTGTTSNLVVELDSSELDAADYSKFLGGSFKVVLRGAAAESFATKGAEAELLLTFRFVAYE